MSEKDEGYFQCDGEGIFQGDSYVIERLFQIGAMGQNFRTDSVKKNEIYGCVGTKRKFFFGRGLGDELIIDLQKIK